MLLRLLAIQGAGRSLWKANFSGGKKGSLPLTSKTLNGEKSGPGLPLLSDLNYVTNFSETQFLHV